jgi:nucleoid-associated protein YgaU
MSRRFLLILAVAICLAGVNPARSQDATAADPAAPASDDITTLKAQNAALKKEVSDATDTITKLQAQLAASGVTPATAAPAGPQKALPLDAPNPAPALAPAAAGTPDTAAAAGASAASTTPGRTYTVIKGDSLWKIAHKMYPGDTKNGVDKLQEANKDAIGGKPLKIGQVLVVP